VAVVTEPARILLVDDRPENLLALEAVLGSLGQVLVRAGSGEEALRELLKADFALILLDAQMPGMDGFETAARIKRRTRTKDIPIIFLTAVDKDPDSSYRGYAVGGADYISKPFDPWILRAKVQVFVDLWSAGRRLAAQSVLLRSEIGDGEATVDVLGALGQRLADVEEAVGQLAEELAEVDAADTPALARVEQRLGTMRGTLAALLEGADVKGSDPAHVPRRQPG
jgi:CheY-like chemotaxis protein